MLNRISKFIAESNSIGKFFGSVLLVVVILGEMALGFYAGTLIGMTIEDIFFAGSIPYALAFVIVFTFMLVPLFVDCHYGKKAELNRISKAKQAKYYKAPKPKKADKDLFQILESIRARRERKKAIARRGLMPHFGKQLEFSQKLKVITGRFRPYCDENGEKYRLIKISEDDKWVRILGKYFPLDLICGYNRDMNYVYFIDGSIAELPPLARNEYISGDIDKFFNEKGYYYETLPKESAAAYKAAIDEAGCEIGKADWSKIRYDWEKYMVRNHSYKRAVSKSFNLITHGGKVNEEYLDRVLSTAEIKSVISLVRNGTIPLDWFTDIGQYRNEFSVCNGIMILEELRYPKNKEGMDFLFECLRDVDEAYFRPAVKVLSQMPKKMLGPEIEERAQIAYKNGDVMRAAGLLYLAKNINYEIEFVQKLKDELEANKTIGVGELDENGVMRFATQEGSALQGQTAVAFKSK